MENKIISINISPETDEEINENAGVMWEHNATSLVFNIDSAYVDDYRYYIEYRSLIGTLVRTEYLELNTATNKITYDIPVTMTSLRGVECYFNIVKIDEDGQTAQVIKPKRFYLQFDYAPDTDNSLEKEYDFTINALLEAIRLGVFQGGSGGVTVVDSKMSDTSSNPVQNKIAKQYVDTAVANAQKYIDSKESSIYQNLNKTLPQTFVSKENGKGLSSNDFTDEYKNLLDNAETELALKVTNVQESTADGGSNIVTFSDGSTVSIKNGSKGSKGDKGDKGDSPIKGTDYFTESDKKEIKDESITLISTELAKRGQVKPEFANNIGECTDTTKLYVLPDNHFYAYMMSTVYPEITAKENSVGYYYDNKGVVTWYADNPNSCSKETNLIPVNEGDIFNVTLRGGDGSAVNGAWYDADKNLISIIKITDSNYNAVTTQLTAPTGAKYAWFTSYSWSTNMSSVPWSVEWVYCSTATSEKWTDTGHAFVPADYESEILDHEKRLEQLESQKVESILKGKKIVYDGDSLCAPGGNLNGGAYPKLIADLVGGTYDNQAVGGARIVTAKGATNKDGVSVTLSHSVVDNLVNLPTNADLYCFECCVNDQFNMVTLGDFNPTEYSEDKLSLNTKEYCGALETIIRYALTNFNGAPVCFIIPHKCNAQGDYGNGFTFADFREKIIGLFEKYAIPYYDAWAESGLNYWNKTHLDNYFLNFDTNTETGDGDGCHPNTAGYKRYYVPQLISLFEKIMPRG